jgi:hypothetical protein
MLRPVGQLTLKFGLRNVKAAAIVLRSHQHDCTNQFNQKIYRTIERSNAKLRLCFIGLMIKQLAVP